jgi:hypothetical protein
MDRDGHVIDAEEYPVRLESDFPELGNAYLL